MSINGMDFTMTIYDLFYSYLHFKMYCWYYILFHSIKICKLLILKTVAYKYKFTAFCIGFHLLLIFSQNQMVQALKFDIGIENLYQTCFSFRKIIFGLCDSNTCRDFDDRFSIYTHCLGHIQPSFELG